MNIIINPGAGPVLQATETEAILNIKHLITDLNNSEINWVRIPQKDYGEGRFAFLLWEEGGNRCHEVQMPGLPLDKVRFMGEI